MRERDDGDCAQDLGIWIVSLVCIVSSPENRRDYRWFFLSSPFIVSLTRFALTTINYLHMCTDAWELELS